MGIAELGHTGLHVEDLDVMRDFYARVLGLTVTDEAPELGASFLSSRPDVEHHEIVLAKGRTAPRDVKLINQISWRVDDLPSLQSLYRAILDYGSPIRMVITHGNAIGVYFSDPEGEFKLTPEYEFTAPGNDPSKVAIFKDLQAFTDVNLVVPVGEQHMYWAAMNSKSCKLTPFGKRYWRLVKHNRV